MPDTPNREEPQAREPCKCLKGQSYREILAKEARKKDSDEATTPISSGDSPCPCTIHAARVPASQTDAPLSRSTLTGADLPQAKRLASVHAGSLR